jgi:hypothetical protein
MTRHRWVLTGFAVAALALGACNSGSGTSEPKVEAVTIVEDEATGLKTLTLSDKAAERLRRRDRRRDRDAHGRPAEWRAGRDDRGSRAVRRRDRRRRRALITV